MDSSFRLFLGKIWGEPPRNRRAAVGGTVWKRTIAAFHLKVIRVFLATQTPQATQSLPTQAPYSVAPGHILNDDQATTLRTMLAEFAPKLPKAKQGAFMMQGWAKLKAHFGTDYRHIPASQYFDALSIIARHIAAWDDGASATPLPTDQTHQGEKPTASDMANLRNMIYLCTTGFHYQGAWTQAIWAYLRKALGVPSAQGYTVDHLPRLAQELQYVASATSQMHELMTEMEREAARRIFRKSELCEMVVAQIEAEARTKVQSKVTSLASLPSYLQRDIAAITQRLQNHTNRGGDGAMGFAV